MQQNQVANPFGTKSMNQKVPICYNCGQKGHKSTYCQENKIDESVLDKIREDNKIHGTNDKVMCFHCNQYGHYANVCPHKRQQKVSTMMYGGQE